MIDLFKVHMPEAVTEPLLETLFSGYITQGQKVDEFEAAFGEKFGYEYVASVNSGTSALTLALRLAGVKKDSEVVTTAMTCSATNLPILSLSGVPVFADIDPNTGLIDPKSIDKLVTSKTKAIMAVDWGGLPVDVKSLQAIADKWGIKLIIDAAHAIGVRHNAQPDFLCYSLQAIKHITTIDGGMLVSKSEADHERAKLLRWFGINREKASKDTRIDEDITDWGYKFHMNDVAATIGLVQLDFVDDITRAHKMNAAYYREHLGGDNDFFIQPPYEGTFWLYTLLLPNREYRDAFKDHMLANGIQVSQVHKRNDAYTVFKPFARQLPGVDQFSESMICIPVHWGLTSDERKHILKTANGFFEVIR